MAAFDPATLDRWRALAIVDRDGTTVGTISEFYLDRETSYPTWALVNTGLFGAHQTFVPLVHATEIADGLQVPYAKSHIKDAPRVDLHDELTPAEEATLFAHYGVDYEPSPEQAATTVEGPGPVPAQPGPAEAPAQARPGPAETPAPGPEQDGSAAAEPGQVGSAAGPELGATADAELRSVEGPGPVPAQPGSVEAQESGPTQPGSVEARESGPTQPGPAKAQEPGLAQEPGPAQGPGPAQPGSLASAEAVDGGPGSVPPEPTETTPAEPGADEATAGRDGLRPDAAGGPVPDEPSTTDPDEATRVDQQGLRAEALEPQGPEAALPRGETPAEGDPDLSRTAPVEPGLPGSTAASPYGPPTTIDKDAEQPAQEPVRSQDEVAWPPGPAGGFEEQVPLDRPARSSDRWREAKQAAERERATRTPSTPSEERSPLERARRGLERLVGVGQEPPDPEDISPTDQDAAERARRARLGLEEDDDRRR